ncbi:hypothetical protein N779_05710 [Vibrio coralliilyticus OCN008]|nr:hypothetical protein N779_05710 [Vibrio coralliilyticus OCN008]KFI09251.1 hypothetical protein IX95_25605 [Vibrio sp. B183]
MLLGTTFYSDTFIKTGLIVGIQVISDMLSIGCFRICLRRHLDLRIVPLTCSQDTIAFISFVVKHADSTVFERVRYNQRAAGFDALKANLSGFAIGNKKARSIERA